MSVLVVGISHRTAPVELLEQLAITGADATKLCHVALDSEHVSEAVVLATCNRLEIYAEVERFHGSVDDISALITDRPGVDRPAAVASLYVHYDEGAVAHLFSVAAGLKSMVVGESQILGQVRGALRRAQADETVGPALNSLFQQGLRVGKRVHTETSIDTAGQSMVSVALEQASEALGRLEGARAAIVGAGSMAALASQSLRAEGVADLVISSRTAEAAERLAGATGARVVGLDELPGCLGDIDLLVSCTGARGQVIEAEALREARDGCESPLAIVDLALPHDVDRDAGSLPGVTLIDIQALSEVASEVAVGRGDAISGAEQIVTREVSAFAAARDAARVTPTVVALRSMSSAVVEAELERLYAKVPQLDEAARSAIAQTLRRTADKLLHEPTVRVQELAGRTPESSYADALAELFALDPRTVEAVSSASKAASADATRADAITTSRDGDQ